MMIRAKNAEEFQGNLLEKYFMKTKERREREEKKEDPHKNNYFIFIHF